VFAQREQGCGVGTCSSDGATAGGVRESLTWQAPKNDSRTNRVDPNAGGLHPL